MYLRSRVAVIHVNGVWQPRANFPRRFRPVETQYYAFGRELLAVFLASVPSFTFPSFSRGRQFCMYIRSYTDLSHTVIRSAFHVKNTRPTN